MSNGGVCSHSTVSAQEEWVIFASLTPLSTEWILQKLSIPYKRVQGFYKGADEDSFLVPAGKVEELRIEYAAAFDTQEHVLYLQTANARGQRPAWLVSLNTANEEYIGMFQETVLGPVDGQDYTYDPSTDKYFIVAPYFNASDKPLTPFTSDEQRAYWAYRQRVEGK